MSGQFPCQTDIFEQILSGFAKTFQIAMLPRYHGFSDSRRGGGPFLVIPPNNIFRLPDIYIFEGEAEYDVVEPN